MLMDLTFVKRNRNFFLSLILFIGSILLAFLGAYFGLLVSVLFIGLAVGAALVIAILFNERYGIYLAYIVSFFIMGLHRFYDFNEIPIAMVIEIFVFVTILSIAINRKDLRNLKFDYNTVNVLILIWIAYHFLQILNPVAASRIAWFYAARNTFLIVIVYFVLSYMTKSERFVATMLKIWITMTLLAAIYCLKQEYFGLFSFENNWLFSNPDRVKLLVTWGKVRKFSFMEGPMVLGISLAYTSVLCFSLLTGPFAIRNKILLALAGAIMVWAMFFTGTRTATILLPVGLIFFAILTLNRKVLIAVGIFMILGTGLILAPTGNPNIFIMKTAFRGGEDASMNVRLTNQELIQPFLQSHPFGAGVGSTGGWGARFSPHTFIGSFPPDSEYLRIAIEFGWVGLLYYCLMLFFILKMGIDNYFKTKDLRIRTYYVGILTVTFMTVIAMYS